MSLVGTAGLNASLDRGAPIVVDSNPNSLQQTPRGPSAPYGAGQQQQQFTPPQQNTPTQEGALWEPLAGMVPPSPPPSQQTLLPGMAPPPPQGPAPTQQSLLPGMAPPPPQQQQQQQFQQGGAPPGANANPNQQSLLPGMAPTNPNQQSLLPGMAPTNPNQQSLLPGMAPTNPNQQSLLPGMAPTNPNQQQQQQQQWQQQRPPMYQQQPMQPQPALNTHIANAALAPTASSEDIVRAQVLTLFSRCDNDMEKTIHTIARTLRESGRHDVKVESDPKGAIMTVSQDLRHAQGSKSSDFVRKLNTIMEAHEKEIAPVRAIATGQPLPEDYDRYGNTGGGDYHMADLSRFKHHQKDAKTNKLPRCFKQTDQDLKRRAFPTSKYNGNYLLQRYGGCFPDHGNYGFYRKYGAKGCGAATSEYHNYPGGHAPQPTTMYW